MKRAWKVFTALICAFIACFALAACSGGAPKHDVTRENYSVTAESVAAKLDEFITGHEDRTTYTDAEQAAAEYLCDKLADYGYADASVDEFTVIESEKVTYTGRNVTAIYASDVANAKNVIIGAYYDNNYSPSYNGKVLGTHSHGALSNGTSVATLLAVAEYLETEKPNLGFDVSIVFFGAGNTTDVGARRYYESIQSDLARTVLMIELNRIGADNVYAYSDSRETKREKLFDRIAEDNGLGIYKPTQKSPLITSLYALNGVPYYQWVQAGLFPLFFNNGIPTLNLIGGNYETMDVTDREFADHPNVTNTENDTLASLKANNPDYADNMASAATLVIKSPEAPDFLDTVIYDKANFPNTNILMMRWVWYLVVLGVIGIAYAVMTLINAHLGKKYPIKPVQPPRNIKMAVFGMDYEDKNADNIFIDIRDASSSPADDIFPGVPNNEKSSEHKDDDGQGK